MNGAHVCIECGNIGNWKSPDDPTSDKKFQCPKCATEYTFDEFRALPYYTEKQLTRTHKKQTKTPVLSPELLTEIALAKMLKPIPSSPFPFDYEDMEREMDLSLFGHRITWNRTLIQKLNENILGESDPIEWSESNHPLFWVILDLDSEFSAKARANPNMTYCELLELLEARNYEIEYLKEHGIDDN